MELWTGACLACLAVLCLALCQIALSIAVGRWKLRHLPGAPSHLFFGSLDIWPRRAIEAGRKWRSEHGDVAKFFLGSRPMVMLYDPDHVGQVFKTLSAFPGRFVASSVEGKTPSLLVVEGRLWKFLRNSTAPIFFKSKLARFTGVVEKCAGAMVRQLGVDGREGHSVEVLEAFRVMTLDVIGTVAFGVEINTIKDEKGEFGTVLRDFLQASRSIVPRGGLPFMVMVALGSMGLQLPPLVVKRLPVVQPFRRCAQLINLTITSIIKSRRKQPAMEDKAKRDFITLMIEARERESGRALNDLEIMYNSRLFLLAGHETTAGTLAIFLFHVTQHPEVQKKIVEEVDRLNDGEPLSYESLEKYRYMEMVLNESMRMLSVVPMLSRKASRDFHLGGTVLIPNGTGIVIPVHLLHHDAKLWGDPENFRPERFDPDSDEFRQRNPHAFVPFGGGPRVCIGLKFAMMEMLLVLIMLYRQYTFSLDSSRTATPLQYTASMTVEPTDGIHLFVHKRENGRDVGVKAP